MSVNVINSIPKSFNTMSKSNSNVIIISFMFDDMKQNNILSYSFLLKMMSRHNNPLALNNLYGKKVDNNAGSETANDS